MSSTAIDNPMFYVLLQSLLAQFQFIKAQHRSKTKLGCSRGDFSRKWNWVDIPSSNNLPDSKIRNSSETSFRPYKNLGSLHKER